MTGAVRDYVASAPAAERERRYGQQQWGLFETDYQRRKGISTEESLQEIEDFAAHGARPPPAPRPSAGPGAAVQQQQQQSPSSSSGGGLSAGRFGGGGVASGPAARTDRFGPGGAGGGADAGASFFAQHQQREAAKFKPGYRGAPPPQ